MAKPWCSKTHLDSVVSKFTQLQMNDSQTDVTVRAGSLEFKAHKDVLAASSGYFMSLFTLEFKEKSQSVVTIDCLPCESVMQLLHFCYTASLDLSDENILDIIQSACYLQMEHAIQLSLDYVKTTKRCDVPSHWKLVCEAASLAESHGLSESYELCLDKIAYWFSAIYKTEMFVNLLTFEVLHKLLDRPELTKFRDFEKEMGSHEESTVKEYPNEITAEDQVLEAVVGWLKHDWENRKCHTTSLLGKVRLGTVDSAKLDELIDEEMRAIEGCQDIMTVVEEKKNEGDPSPTQAPLSVTMPEMFCPRGSIHTLIGVRSHGMSYLYYNDPNPKKIGIQQSKTSRCFPTPHEDKLYNQSAIAVNGHLYVSHGRDEEKSFYKFDPCAARWDPINFHHPSIQCSLVYLDGWIYALGGKYYGRGNDTFARRYNIQDDKEEVLHPEYESITLFTTAVAYLGKVLVFSKESPVNGESKFILSVYDPVMNRWFVVFTEHHRVHGGTDAPLPHNCWNIALVIHENKCYRVFYEDIGSQREGWLKPRVNEIVFDFKDETPSCRLGESQEQFGFTELLDCYSDQFCIKGEVYMFVNRYPLRTGHRMTPNEDVGLLKRRWEPLYLFLDKDSAVTHYTFDINLFE